MKNLLQHLFTFSIILFALGFALPIHAQAGEEAGPPAVRKEGQDGGTGGSSNCLSDNGQPGSLSYFVTYGNDYPLPDCNLFIEIVWNDVTTYIPLSADDFEEDDTYENIFNFEVEFTAAQIATICAGDPFYFTIGLTCLDGGGYKGIKGSEGTRGNDDPSSLKPTCCSIDEELETEVDSDPLGDGDGGRGGSLVSDNTTHNYKFVQSQRLGSNPINSKNTTLDYYIYDLHGNQIKVLKESPIENSLQSLILRSDIRTGIYFVRYTDGGQIKTQKVFKY